MTIYGESDPRRGDERVGVIAFNVGSLPHALVAAILGYEAGIGVRSGCFCAQSYVAHLLGLAEGEQARWHREHLAGDRSRRPGMVRMSLGVYNTVEDVDALVAMLQRIVRNDYRGRYDQVPESGDYMPAGYEDPISSHFSFVGGGRASSRPHADERPDDARKKGLDGRGSAAARAPRRTPRAVRSSR